MPTATAVVVSQVDGPRWLSFEGTYESLEIKKRYVAEERYARRYRQPAERDDRVAIIDVDRVLGRRPKPVKTVVLHLGRVIEQSPIKTGLAFRTPIQRAVIWWRSTLRSNHRTGCTRGRFSVHLERHEIDESVVSQSVEVFVQFAMRSSRA